VLGLLESTLRTLYTLVYAQQEGDKFVSNSLHILFLVLTDASFWVVGAKLEGMLVGLTNASFWAFAAKLEGRLVSRRRSSFDGFPIVIVDSKAKMVINLWK
jgi:hypothetical protein